jgi:esterase/lipase superfamily enzyme
MKREYHKWFSPSLGRDMELLVFGHCGIPALVFPTSQGRFYEFEDRGMVHAVAGDI